MSAFHVFLRVAVCLALILNGSGLALAGAQMMDGVNDVALTVQATHTPCAEHVAMPDDGGIAPVADHDASDCCSTGDCHADCSVCLQIALVPTVAGWRAVRHTPHVHSMIHHVPKRLFHDRYRPPIH